MNAYKAIPENLVMSLRFYYSPFRRAAANATERQELVSAHRPRLFFWTPLTNVAWCLKECCV